VDMDRHRLDKVLVAPLKINGDDLTEERTGRMMY